MAQLKLRILSIEKVMVDEPVDSLSLSTSDGTTTILPHHISLLSTVEPGLIRYRRSGEEVRLVSSSGSVEVTPQGVTVLVEEAVPLDAIDLARVQAEQSRLLNVLRSGDLPLMQLKEARKQLANVNAKVRLAQKS
jgi:F-type H+-transporting ATPase subunit epsilon